MKFIVFLLFVYSILPAMAQNVQMKYSDGRIFNPDSFIVETDTCIFSVLNGVADWKVYMKARSIVGDTWDEECLEKRQSSSLMFYPALLDAPWNEIDRVEDVSSGDVYYYGYVVCDMGGVNDTVHLCFNIAPQKPCFKAVTFKYEAFDEDLFEFVSPLYYCQISSKGAKGMRARCTEYFPSRPNPYFFFLDYGPEIEVINDTTFLVSGDWTWDQKIFFYATNEFGYSQDSDTLYTSNYIEDPYINGVIEDYLTNVSDVSIQETDIRIQNNNIVVDESHKVKRIVLYNLDGKIIKSTYGVNFLDVSSLTRGMYIVRVMTECNQEQTKKIVL